MICRCVRWLARAVLITRWRERVGGSIWRRNLSRAGAVMSMCRTVFIVPNLAVQGARCDMRFAHDETATLAGRSQYANGDRETSFTVSTCLLQHPCCTWDSSNFTCSASSSVPPLSSSSQTATCEPGAWIIPPLATTLLVFFVALLPPLLGLACCYRHEKRMHRKIRM